MDKKENPLGIFSVATDGTMCPVVDSDSKNEYQETPGGKDDRCVRMTTLPPSQSRKSRKSGSLNLPDPQTPAQVCNGKTLPFNEENHERLQNGLIWLIRIQCENIFIVNVTACC
jgi:hypothetical protein